LSTSNPASLTKPSPTHGVPTTPETISGNHPLPIKSNLESALQYLRPPAGHPPRRLWIDALCIDQSSTSERSRQVQYIRLVYKHYSRVIAWLGSKTDDTAATFEAARRLSDVGRLVAEIQDSSPSATNINDFVRDATNTALSNLPPNSLSSLASLFDREYFHRTWVVQEIAVSATAIAKCDDLEMPFFDLVSNFLFVFGNRESIVTTTSLDVWYLIFAQRSGRQSGHVRLTDVPGSLGPLLDLLENMRAFRATDVRDKIYSVLGICDEGLQPILTHTHITRQTDRWLGPLTGAVTRLKNFVNASNPDLSWGIPAALKPDYARDVPAVYTDLARYMTSKSPMFLDVLSFVQHKVAPPAFPAPGEFPSWVPKWFETKTFAVFRESNFGAGRCVPPLSDLVVSRVQRAFSGIPGSLTLDGFHVGVVHRVSEPMIFTPHGDSKTEAVKSAWDQLLPNLKGVFPRPTQLYRTGEPFKVAFYKALSAHPQGAFYGSVLSNAAMGFRFPDVEGQMNRESMLEVGEAATQAFLAGLGGQELDERAAKNAVAFRTRMDLYCYKRRAFLTREGHLGIGPTVMQPGDEVVVLFRGRMPYVLRLAGPSRHVFLGDCYVRDEDIMYGKVTESLRHGREGPLARFYEMR